MADLSVVVVSWNTRDLLAACLRSVLATAGSLRLELIVVDNASTDGSADMVRAEFGGRPEVTLIANTDNLGFAAASNLGYERSSAEHVLLLNPDTIVQPRALARMLSHAREHPGDGIVASLLLNIDGTLQRHYYRFPRPRDVFFTRTILGYHLDQRLMRSRHLSHHNVRDIDFETITYGLQPSAVCSLVSRATVDAAGGLFDEKFPLFYNDVDLCRRVVDCGSQIAVLPDVTVVHHGGAAVALLAPHQVDAALYRSAVRYFHKHHGRGPALLVTLLVIVGAVTNPLLRLAGRARDVAREWRGTPVQAGRMFR